MAYNCDIKATAKHDLHSSAIDPDRLLLRAGDTFRIVTIHCHNGPYTCEGGPKGRFTVPRSWLVECGALEPFPSPSQLDKSAGGTPEEERTKRDG